MSPVGDKIWVSLANNTVVSYSTVTDTLVNTISNVVGSFSGPQVLAVTPDNNMLLVANGGGTNNLSFISLTGASLTGVSGTPIALTAATVYNGLRITSSGVRAFVVAQAGTSTLDRIDLTTTPPSTTTTSSIGASSNNMVIAPDDSILLDFNSVAVTYLFPFVDTSAVTFNATVTNGGCVTPDSQNFFAVGASNLYYASLKYFLWLGTVSGFTPSTGKTCLIQPDDARKIWILNNVNTAGNINILDTSSFNTIASLSVTGPNLDIVFVP